MRRQTRTPCAKSCSVVAAHGRLFRRVLEILAEPGVTREQGEGFVVMAGSGDALPAELPLDPEAFASEMLARHPHCATEVELFRRSGGALPEVLLGEADPLALLFSGGEPSAADMYRKAPVWRAANRMLGAAIPRLVDGLPEGRRLRVLEVGAGVGSATATVLPELPADRFDYTYTDISAGFFAEAETRFSDSGAPIEYRVLDIEKDPVAQGFEPHAYDLVIAANVLHATRYLGETLAHCRRLLAPSGLLVALENHRGEGWLDLAFGQLDGWWRFADAYRVHHALAGPEAWTQALGDAGFEAVEILGPEKEAAAELPDRGVIVARGPAEVKASPGVWVLAGDGCTTEELARELAARNQTVVVAATRPRTGRRRRTGTRRQALPDVPGIVRTSVDAARRESWRTLVDNLPADLPLEGVVHLAALDGHGAPATTAELAADARQAGAGALALVQGLADADATPAKGVWFVTRGAQVLEKERGGNLAGAALWGFGKVVAREMPHLQPRMIDLDPAANAPAADLATELMHPDAETHVAYRQGIRRAARLVRCGAAAARLTLPAESGWMLAPDPGGDLDNLRVEPLPPQPLEPGEVRVAVEAVGLNFLDVFRGIGMIDTGRLGEEMCGRVVETGAGVTTVSTGDRVAGFAFGTFGSEAVTPEALVVPAPPGVPVAALATMPTVFVTAALSFQLADLKAGERVLIHAGAGGVGLAAIQLARAAGAEVFATASAAKAGLPARPGRGARVRQPAHGLRPGNPRRHGRRGRSRGAQQPDGRGLHRRQPVLPGAGRPVRGAGQAGHPERAGDGGGAARRRLRDPGAGRPQAARPGAAGRRPPDGDGTSGGRRAGAAGPQPLVADRDGAGDGLHARGAARGKERPDDAAPRRGTAAGRPLLPGDRRPGRYRLRPGRLAGGPRRRLHRAERAPRSRPGGRGGDRGAARARRARAGRARRRHRHRGAGRHAGAHRRHAAARSRASFTAWACCRTAP